MWQSSMPQKTLFQGVELTVRSTFILGQTKDLMSAVGRQTVAAEAFDQVELSYIAAISSTLAGHSCG